MIILFANQKGGVGKSTLSVSFANYLALIQQKEVVIFDMDFQRSIYNKAKQAKQVIENKPLYEVEEADLTQFPIILDANKADPDLITILDLPGKMDDDNLIPVFMGADLIFSPFAYDEYSVNSTLEFAFLVKEINPKAHIIFIPNRIKANVRYETLESVNDALNQFGQITEAIPDRIDFARITTYDTPLSVIKVISPIFELIHNNYFLTNKQLV